MKLRSFEPGKAVGILHRLTKIRVYVSTFNEGIRGVASINCRLTRIIQNKDIK